jgi:hypothetical protein
MKSFSVLSFKKYDASILYYINYLKRKLFFEQIYTRYTWRICKNYGLCFSMVSALGGRSL